MGEERASEIGQRIREARQRRGLSLADLAEQTGVDKSTLSRMEAGQRRVTATTLADLADVLGVSMRDLVRPRQPRPHYAVAARLRETSTNEVVAAALHRAHTLLELEGLVDELEIPVDVLRAPLSIDLPSESSPGGAGEELASRVRDALQLGVHPVIDLEQFAEQHLGVDVALHPLGDDQGVSGLAVSAPQTDNSRSVRFALVNSSPTLGHQRFTLAHEIGHLLFGDAEEPLVDAGLSSDSPAEARANAFAAELLLPASAVKRVAEGQTVTRQAVLDLVTTFQVSWTMAVIRLGALRLVSEEDKHALSDVSPRQLAFAANRSDWWQAAESWRGRVRLPSSLRARLLRAFQAGVVGTGPMAALLDLPADHVPGYLEGQGITARPEGGTELIEVL